MGTGSVQSAEGTGGAAGRWEQRYASTDRAWSGKPNETLVGLASDLEPGRAFDLGCGEGADALWLAQRGWRVEGVDFSQTAVSRGQEAAEAAGVGDLVRFYVGDLLRWQPDDCDGGADLVTAMFLHSHDDQDRDGLVRAAAGLVGAGGRLIVVSHAVAPPWSKHAHGEGLLVDPRRDCDLIEGVGHCSWKVEVCEIREREAVGPGGRVAKLQDAVVMMLRRA